MKVVARIVQVVAALALLAGAPGQAVEKPDQGGPDRRVAITIDDRAACDSLATHYLAYLDGIAAHFEALSLRLLGREPAQTLLLHANWLNAERLDGVLGVLAARGYRVVPLEEALEDPAYALPDSYIGKRGMSWLERWALTRGEDPGVMPEAPAWVRRAAGLKEQG